MKHRLVTLFFISSFLFVQLLSGLAGFVSPAFTKPVASAAGGPEVAFNGSSDPATISKIVDLLKGNDSGAALNSTQVIGRGGLWGDGTVFAYVKSVDRGTDHKGIQYSTNYYCVNGKPQLEQGDSDAGTIKIEASVYAALPDDYFKQPTIDFQAHTSHITYTPKQIAGEPTSKTQEFSYSPVGNGLDINPLKPGKNEHITVDGKDILSGCDTTIATNGGSMPNLMSNKTTQAVKDDWKNALQNNGSTSGSVGGSSSGSSSGGDIGLTCSIKFSNPLTWLLCPAIKGMLDIVGFVDNLITSQLSIGTDGQSDDPNQIFCKTPTATGSCQAYRQAWSSVRNIALGLIVITGLVVVIAQAVGTEIIDAYTIKKVLPRVVIAAIAITLSWELMRLFVTFTNDLGYGVRYLIYQPFNQLGIGNSDVIQGTSGVATGLVVNGAIAGLAIFGQLSLAVTAALAVGIAFLILIIRQLVIIVLIIFAPIAIVAYTLPNTQNIYKLWWDSFAKALLMFPIIAAMIATGRVFAAASTINNDAALGHLVGFAAYFAPYLLLPFAFKFAGGALRNIGGMVNDRGRGAFDRLRKHRGERFQDTFSRSQENRRFNPNRGGILGRSNRAINSALSSATSPTAAAKIYGGLAINKAAKRMGRDAPVTSLGVGIMDQINQTKFQHSQKLGEKLNGLGMNDRALKTLMQLDDFSAGSIRGAAQKLQNSDNSTDRLAGAQLAQQSTFLAQQLYSDPEMGRADVGLAAGLAISAQGFGDTHDMVDLANRRLGGSEPGGLGAAYVTNAQLSGQRAGRLDQKAGYGVQIGKDGNYVAMGAKVDKDNNITSSGEEIKRMEGHQVKRLLTMSQQDLQGAKAPSVAAMAPGFEAILQTTNFDSSGVAKYEFLNERGEADSMDITRGDVSRVAAMMGTAQSDYSGTSPGTSQEISKIIDRANLTGDAKAAYDRASRQQDDPRRNLGEPPPEPEAPK